MFLLPVTHSFFLPGDAALEMEALSDEEVQAGIVELFRTFPSVPLPQGARMPPRVLRSQWGRDELFRGSYSYLRAGVEDGQAIDLIAQVGKTSRFMCTFSNLYLFQYFSPS